MFRYCTNIALALVVAGSLSSCRSRVSTDNQHLSEVQTATAPAQADVRAEIGERFDPAQEEVVANQSLQAWRRAISHKAKGTMNDDEWKKLRAEDEKESMATLKDLSERYPKNSTVHLMMGQVMHEFGREKEAEAFFEEAIARNSGSSVYIFKLAESARTAGDTDKAIANYRKLLTKDKTFIPAQIGLAKCLLKKDPHSAEARELIQAALDKDRENKDAIEVKKQLDATK